MKKIVLFSACVLVSCSSFAQSIVQAAYDTLRAKGYHDVYRLVHNNYNCPEVDFYAAKFIAINPQGHIEDGVVCNGKIYQSKVTTENNVLVLK